MEKYAIAVILYILSVSFTVFGQLGPVDVFIQQAPQPSSTLAPLGATWLPFTRVTLLAPNADKTVDGIVVERTSLSVDAVLNEILLLDESGMEIGFGGFLNSNHQATLSGKLALKKGEPRTFTIAANRPSWSNAAHAGMTVDLYVVGFITPLTMSGELPVMGATHTINESLSIGTVVCNRGQMDPGTSLTKNVGTAGYTFSSIRITAGSAEPVRVKAIRWTQTGSAIPSDIMNPKIWVDGVAYEVSVSPDGKSYFASFGSTVTISRGFSKEIRISADIVDGHGRTVDFDIVRRGDLYLEGATYGFGIRPPLAAMAAPADSAQFSMVEDPWYDAAQVTITVVASGEFVVKTDAATPPASTVKAGDVGVTVLIAKLSTTVEKQKLEGFGLALTGSRQTIKDGRYELYVGPIKVGEGVFVENNRSTASLFPTTLPMEEHVSLKIVVDISEHAAHGDTIAVEYRAEDTYTTGLMSGVRIKATGTAKGNTFTVVKPGGGGGSGGGGQGGGTLPVEPPSPPSGETGSGGGGGQGGSSIRSGAEVTEFVVREVNYRPIMGGPLDGRMLGAVWLHNGVAFHRGMVLRFSLADDESGYWETGFWSDDFFSNVGGLVLIAFLVPEGDLTPESLSQKARVRIFIR